MKISELARKAGVGVETVRFYERKGLISQPNRPVDGGFRSYPEQTIARIKFIRRAQYLGFSLLEVRELLSLRIDPSTDCSQIKKLATVKRLEVTEKIEHLKIIRAALDTIIGNCPGAGNIRECSIVEEMEKGQEL